MATPRFPNCCCRHHLTLTLLLFLAPLLAAADRVLEDGYAVTTVADLNHLPATSGPASGIHPYALVPRSRAGDLLVLDSAGSALYTLVLSPGAGGGGVEPRRLAGGVREAGYTDGGPEDAAFDRPRSVAVDGADNVYVADRIYGAIRKVAPSGFTTTIAGGLSSGNGHRDGPAQNATFSPDFELVYVPRICALLVTDRGNRLIRQVNLKPEDCARETHTGLGAISELSINHFLSRMQKKYKRTQRKATLISFCDIRSAVANSMFYALLLKVVRISIGYLTVVFPSVRLELAVSHKRSHLAKVDKAVAAPSTGLLNKALAPNELLGDLISFGGHTSEKEDNGIICGGSSNSEDSKVPSFDGDLMELLYTPQDSLKKIDHMIEANLSDFSSQEECHGLAVNSCNVSRRRLHGDRKVM